MRLSLNLVRLYAILSRPFVPDASAAMLAAFGLQDGAWPGAGAGDVRACLETLEPGRSFTTPDVLFSKITDEAREGFAARFAGTR